MLYHIRNANYSGPLQKELSDIMFTKHSDVEHFYNTFSHPGITESYPTVNGRQAKMSAERDVKQQLPDLENRITIHIWDNFVKGHTVQDTVYGCPQTTNIELLNRTLVMILSPSPCKSCVRPCTCY